MQWNWNFKLLDHLIRFLGQFSSDHKCMVIRAVIPWRAASIWCRGCNQNILWFYRLQEMKPRRIFRAKNQLFLVFSSIWEGIVFLAREITFCVSNSENLSEKYRREKFLPFTHDNMIWRDEKNGRFLFEFRTRFLSVEIERFKYPREMNACWIFSILLACV